jgi:hypothetical protein
LRVLYITFDGLLEPLGNSQIFAPVAALARRGIRYHVLSLEKRRDLRDTTRTAAKRELLGKAGADWSFLPYEDGGGMAQVARNVGRLTRMALMITQRQRIDVVHARAHLSAAVAWLVRRARAAPYLFDFRGYWVDEQREQGRWVSRALPYGIAKRAEAQLIRDAAGIVTLTELAAADLRRGMLGRAGPQCPVTTITTIADYARFTIDGDTTAVPTFIRRRLAGKLVVAYIGAINASYDVESTLALFRELHGLRPDAHLLCLTQQAPLMESRLREASIGSDAWTIASVSHEAMNEWLRLVDWCLLLLKGPVAKRASMPTKLAELFAAGVRPLQHGCNPEVSDWVGRAGSGYVLHSLDAAALRAAAVHVMQRPLDREELLLARERTWPHFSLECGVERYAHLLEQIVCERSISRSVDTPLKGIST